MNTTLAGLKVAFEGRGYRIAGALIFASGFVFYLMTLPSSFTGGRIGIAAMRYLDVELVVFSLVMAVLVALLLPLIAFQVRRGLQTSKASAAGGVAVGVMTPILCCSPALPIALGFVATFFPSLVGAMSWRLQGFIATHQTALFSVASALLVIAVYQNARGVARGPACAVPDSGAPSAGGATTTGMDSAPEAGGTGR